MSKIRFAAVAAAALVSLAAAASAHAAPAAPAPKAKGSKCVMAGGTADMLTEDMARFMANAALNNQMKAEGLKGAGPVKMVCKSGYPVNCTAKQRACK